MPHSPRTTPAGGPQMVDVRTGLSAECLSHAILDNLYYLQGRTPELATRNDWYLALSYAVRDRMLHRWTKTIRTLSAHDVRGVAYLSAEFLLGPHLGNNLLSLGIWEEARKATDSLGVSLEDLLAQEEEPGLGNGGLGRLAACYLDSLATLEVPAIGYGIRYEFGIFDQEIRDGWQSEITDLWLRLGNPWEIPRPEITYTIHFGGHTEAYQDSGGQYRVRWVPERAVRGIAYDTPILGYRVNTVNLLRLWQAQAVHSFDFRAFNLGDYYGAVDEKVKSENLTKVLYPNDEAVQGKRLRLEQQYFFVSCALQDLLRIHSVAGRPLETLHEKFAIQLNDTHPAIAIPEMMRLLVDERDMSWDAAWGMVRNTFSYTNHTLLPEALEKWPLPLFGSVLPRHLEIIFEINRRFLEDVRRGSPGDEGLVQRLSMIDESGPKYVRMAHLASVGSHTINGVAALHTSLLEADVLRDFYQHWPRRFCNVTNGVTPRRWIALANPRLAELISSRIGDRWISRLEEEIPKIERLADDTDFQRAWREVTRQNKADLAKLVQARTGVLIDPDSLLDVQVKRIHEYKRQHLNVLGILTAYCRMKRDPQAYVVPRTCLFGGKAAPGYAMAKLIIKLINSVAEVINGDPDVAGRLKVVFLPDFNVTNGQRVYPAADLSEQISTAGKEASGTGNMKFAMNGALTIGTLDGANVEIRQAVGADNFFLFGLTAAEVSERKAHGYRPRDYYESNGQLREVLDLISSGHFSRGDRDLFRPLVGSLLERDEYMLLADYQAYVECQDRVSEAYRDQDRWTRMSILNVARMGGFSSDRSIREYCRDIWKAVPVPIALD